MLLARLAQLSKSKFRSITVSLTHTVNAALPWVSPRQAVVRWSALVGIMVCAVCSFWRPNASLAYGKVVRMSSTCQVRPLHSPLPVSGARLVDGSKERAYDACTKREVGPWVSVDLGGSARLDTVVVTGRRDCCWTAALPLVLEVSGDGASYTEVARSALPVSARRPWRITLDHSSGRYVRLRVDRKRPKADIVLSEIEVYGAMLPP